MSPLKWVNDYFIKKIALLKKLIFLDALYERYVKHDFSLLLMNERSNWIFEMNLNENTI